MFNINFRDGDPSELRVFLIHFIKNKFAFELKSDVFQVATIFKIHSFKTIKDNPIYFFSTKMMLIIDLETMKEMIM